MRLLAIMILGVALLPSAGAAAKPPSRPPLAVLVTTLLAHAPENFARLRLRRTDSDADFASYASRTVAGHCSACTIRDDYARGTYAERWVLHDYWNAPKGSKPAANEAYVKKVLAPSLSGYTLHRSLSKYGKYPTLLWNGPRRTWLRIAFDDSGYGIDVGHDLLKPVHVLRAPTRAQFDRLGNAVTNLVRLATQAAPGNFASMRGASAGKDITGNDKYALSTPLGSIFHECDITNVENGLGFKDFQPKWALSCTTAGLATAAATAKPLLHDSVEGALPAGFTEVTDPSSLLFDDYSWDDADAMSSVGIDSFEDRGVARFTITVYHFLPKADGT